MATRSGQSKRMPTSTNFGTWLPLPTMRNCYSASSTIPLACLPGHKSHCIALPLPPPNMFSQYSLLCPSNIFPMRSRIAGSGHRASLWRMPGYAMRMGNTCPRCFEALPIDWFSYFYLCTIASELEPWSISRNFHWAAARFSGCCGSTGTGPACAVWRLVACSVSGACRYRDLSHLSMPECICQCQVVLQAGAAAAGEIGVSTHPLVAGSCDPHSRESVSRSLTSCAVARFF